MVKQAKDLITKYLAEAKVLQLATVGKEGRPWISNVHFVSGKDGNIYWLSTESRRHSVEIAANKNVAVSVVVKSDMPVIGIQAEGVAEKVSDIATIGRIMPGYVKKHGTGKEFYKRALAGINDHKLYVMKPRFYSLFDEVNFPKSAPQIWTITEK